jgi:hypothetical protein
MNCVDFQSWLQRRLDGGCRDDGIGDEPHLSECPECGTLYKALVRLEEGLRHPRPEPSPNLTDRIVDEVLADWRQQRRLRWRRAVPVAVAASLLLAASLFYLWWPRQQVEPKSPPIARQEPESKPAAPSLDENVEELRSALTGVWNVTAEQALASGRVLRPGNVTVPSLPEGATWPSLEPSVETSLQEARQGVPDLGLVAGLGRFVNYFMQELPETAAGRPRGL